MEIPAAGDTGVLNHYCLYYDYDKVFIQSIQSLPDFKDRQDNCIANCDPDAAQRLQL